MARKEDRSGQVFEDSGGHDHPDEDIGYATVTDISEITRTDSTSDLIIEGVANCSAAIEGLKRQVSGVIGKDAEYTEIKPCTQDSSSFGFSSSR